MTLSRENQAAEIIDKALSFGASLAGIANIAELRVSPSHTIAARLADFGGVGTKTVEGRKRGEVDWPDNARSAVVIACEHPAGRPELDWWVEGLSGGTRGNAQLIAVFRKLAEWIEAEHAVSCNRIPYHIEHGGVYMKDAAVLAGLGSVGRSNLLVTPEYGPRVRLRVMLLDADLPSTGPTGFDPCADCEEFCRKACPKNAFENRIYTPEAYGQEELPARSGDYSRVDCNVQMEENSAEAREVAVDETGLTGREVRYCRRCELVCPAGRRR